MKITKLFKILCLFPILAGCNQTPVAEKEQLILATYYGDNTYSMPEEYANAIKEMKLPYYCYYPQYDVTPNEFRDIFTMYGDSYSGINFILYKGELYHVYIGLVSGCENFAYYKGYGKELLYYAEETGNMWHRVRVGAYDFKSKQECTIDFIPSEINTDYVGLVLKTSIKDGELQLEGYKLKVNEEIDSSTRVYYEADLVYENILQYELITWTEYYDKLEALFA